MKYFEKTDTHDVSSDHADTIFSRLCVCLLYFLRFNILIFLVSFSFTML